MGERARRVVVAASMVLACAGVARAGESASELAAASMKKCNEGQQAPTRDQRVALFESGQKEAEQAVALDDANADAHFALFCNLGELLRVDGEKITSVFGFRKMMAELDRTLELNPNHVDALASKGVMLLRLPVLLGGDAKKGEGMLERVVREDPTAVTARLTLADLYDERGARHDAVVFCAQAAELARKQGRADKVAKAEERLEKLKASPTEIKEALEVTHCPGQPGQSCPPQVASAPGQ